jgi:hypothetical protein
MQSWSPRGFEIAIKAMIAGTALCGKQHATTTALV